MKDDSNRGENVIVAIISTIIAYSIGWYFGTKVPNSIPQPKNVQEGFVNLGTLEIKLQDIDGNGKNEVVMKYNGVNYLLTLEKERPEVRDYEITVKK